VSFCLFLRAFSSPCCPRRVTLSIHNCVGCTIGLTWYGKYGKSTKPEVHYKLQRCHRRRKPQETGTRHLVKFGCVVTDISSGQRDRQITDRSRSPTGPGEKKRHRKIITEVVRADGRQEQWSGCDAYQWYAGRCSFYNKRRLLVVDGRKMAVLWTSAVSQQTGRDAGDH